MLLSIIVPIFCGEKFIETCIESFKSQISSDIEVILIDDGSDDSTLGKINYYSNLYDWIVVSHHDNRGVSFTRNKGISIARGEYIWFVDVDDIITEESIDDVKKAILTENPELVIFGYKTKLMRKYLNEFDCIPGIGYGTYDKKKFKHIFWHLYDNNLIHNIGTKVYKKEMLIEHNVKFPLNLNIYEDALFCVQAIEYANKISIIDKVCYCYNLNRNSNSLSRGYKKDYIHGVEYLFSKIGTVIGINSKWREKYLSSLESVFKNEFYNKLYCYNKFKSDLSHVMDSCQIREMKSQDLLSFDENKFWQYVSHEKIFRAYIYISLSVIKEQFIWNFIGDKMIDYIYPLYKKCFKRS